jgi:LPS-assembly protein
LTAEKVIYDREKQQFIYKNAKLRMKGIPVFFTPYFSHPSPEVKRKTGFLTPIFRNLTDIGFFTGFPFYATLGNDKDLTITPFLHSKRRRLASMDYRQKFYHGDLDISASGLSKLKHDKAQIQDKRTRWHVDSVLKSQNFDNKRLMIRLNRASDTTYKNVYPVDLMHRTDMFLRERCNDSKVVCEFYDMNYFLTAESHVYQTADRNTAPKVCPQMTLNCKKDDFLKGELFFDSDTVYLTRKKEKSTMFAEDFFRTTNKVSWQKATDLSPVVLDVKSGVRADIYNVSETEAATRSKNKIFPVFENQISAFVPFISEIKTFNQTSIWGPKVALSSVETSKKRRDFEQNEDSLFDTFSDLNLHSLNRVGYDSVENGERVSAGFENSIYNSKRRWFNTFFGQSRNIGKRQKTKFAGRNSTVGRLALKPMDTLSFRIRFVGMPFMEKTQLFESGVNASYKNVTGGVGYLYDKKISHVQENGVSQLGFTAGINLTNFWSISGAKILNMKKKNGKRALAHGATLTYRDECLEFSAGVCNTKFRVGDIKPRTTIIVSLILKNIGNIITPTSGYGYSASVGQIE